MLKQYLNSETPLLKIIWLVGKETVKDVVIEGSKAMITLTLTMIIINLVLIIYEETIWIIYKSNDLFDFTLVIHKQWIKSSELP